MKILFLVFLLCFGSNALASSLYELESSWKTTEGVATNFSLAKGDTIVVGMIYTGCPHACPLTISKMKSIESALQKNGIKNVRYVLASFDAVGDTPEKLKQYQKEQKLDPKKWIFLSPKSEEDARMLAVALGISFRKIGNGDYAHNNVITMIDKDGKILTKIENLRSEVDVFVKTLKGI